MKKLVLLLLLPLWMISCSEKEQPLTKEEALALGKRLQETVEKGHSQLLDSLFMSPVFADRIAKASGDVGSSYVKSLKDALKKRTLGREMLKSMHEEDTYELLRHYEKDGRHHLVFRMYGQSGINYHDMELVKINDRIALADMYVYLTGENFSKTLAQLLALVAAPPTGPQTGDSMLNTIKSVQEIRTLMNRQQYEKASQLYEALPTSFKQDKAIQLINISITAQLDEEKYRQVLGDFEKQYGQDPSAQLTLFDLYFLDEDYNKALKVLDVLDASVQGDPVLNIYRSVLYTRMQQPEKSIQCLEALYKAKPDFDTGVLELIANYIETNNSEKAETLIAAYRANKKFDQQKLENLKFLYPDFAALNQP